MPAAARRLIASSSGQAVVIGERIDRRRGQRERTVQEARHLSSRHRGIRTELAAAAALRQPRETHPLDIGLESMAVDVAEGRHHARRGRRHTQQRQAQREGNGPMNQARHVRAITAKDGVTRTPPSVPRSASPIGDQRMPVS